MGENLRYGVGYQDGLAQAIRIAEMLRAEWKKDGLSELAHGLGVYLFVVKNWKEEERGRDAGGESGTGTSGAEARVDGGGSEGALDQSVLAVVDGNLGGDLLTGGPSRQGPTPEERLARIRELLNQPEGADSFHVNGFPDQYAALADLYDEDFARELREAVEG